MRLLTRIALAVTLLMPLAACDEVTDIVNAQRGAVEVENGTSFVLQRLFHPPCGEALDGPDRLAGEPDVGPGAILELDLPPSCRDFRADFSDGQRRIITNVVPDNDRRQRITFR